MTTTSDPETLTHNTSSSFISRHRTLLIALTVLYTTLSLLLTLLIPRAVRVLTRPKPQRIPAHQRQRQRRTGHLLIVLGSGGHTAEMLAILHNLGPIYLNSRFERRTWVVSTGDSFSAERAREFEEELGRRAGVEKQQQQEKKQSYNSVTVHRARNIHQSLLTTPVSAMRCLWDALALLRGGHRDLVTSGNDTGYPDLILTNGPGTGVIVVLASLLLLVAGLAPSGSMRSVYVESWARVKGLSLSGKILRFLAGRVLVQWRGLADDGADLTRSDGDQEIDGQSEEEAENVDVDVRIESAPSAWPRRIEYIGAVVT